VYLPFVETIVAKFYGAKDNVSEGPIVIPKMMLLLFLDDVRSERQLMRIIPERLDYMRLLGYGLDDGIPNHSVWSKARKCWGEEVFTWEYVTKWGVYLNCRLREFRTRSRTGRTRRRHRDQKLLDRVRRQANTKQAKLDQKRR
jgi:Transposase domain (DUF772)